MVICGKADSPKRNTASAGVDARDAFERPLGRLDEVGYLRLIHDLGGALEKAFSSVLGGHTLE